jgi:hypothetical protein
MGAADRVAVAKEALKGISIKSPMNVIIRMTGAFTD